MQRYNHQSRASKASNSDGNDSSFAELTSLGKTRQSEEEILASSQLCRFYVLHGRCRFGSRCLYSHEIPSGMSREQAKKFVPCPYFAEGTCRYGDYCQLSHDTQCFDVNDVSHNLAPDGSLETSDVCKIAALSNTQDQSSGAEQIELTCGICLEDVLTSAGENQTTIQRTRNGKVKKKKKQFGLLSCCDHTFCFDCLMEWRKQGSHEASDRRSCPTCRKHSDYVVPSHIFPKSLLEKEKIVKAYKATLSTIPCKRFNGRLGSCPFGSDCFYAHLNRAGRDIKSQDRNMQEICEERQQQRSRNRQRGFGMIDGFADATLIEDDDGLMNFVRLLDLYASQGLHYAYWSDDDESDDDSAFFRGFG